MSSFSAEKTILVCTARLDLIHQYADGLSGVAYDSQTNPNTYAGQTDPNITKGGAICIMHYTGTVLLLAPIGSPPSGKLGRCLFDAQNMCRAILDEKYDQEVVSSWAVRDPEGSPPIYGGGIKLSNGDCLAICAYSEALDETLVIDIGLNWKLLNGQRVQEILMISGHTAQPAVNGWLDNVRL